MLENVVIFLIAAVSITILAVIADLLADWADKHNWFGMFPEEDE